MVCKIQDDYTIIYGNDSHFSAIVLTCDTLFKCEKKESEKEPLSCTILNMFFIYLLIHCLGQMYQIKHTGLRESE